MGEPVVITDQEYNRIKLRQLQDKVDEQANELMKVKRQLAETNRRIDQLNDLCNEIYKTQPLTNS